MPFYTGGVNLNDFFFTDQDIVDQYVNQTGQIWTWGKNYSETVTGLLGQGYKNGGFSVTEPTVITDYYWTQISCASHRDTFTAKISAITADNKLYSWGANNYGQHGNNTTIGASAPAQEITGGTTWKKVASGVGFTAAIKTDGTLWTWGRNHLGQLGDNTTTDRSSPVQTVTRGTEWKDVACGLAHMAAIKTDGTLWLWGNNGVFAYDNFNSIDCSGCLGDNTVVNKSSPIQTITRGVNWKQVSCNGSYTAAVKTDGTLWLWGPNATGNLGNNTTVGASSPVQTITGGTTWRQVSCDSGRGYYSDIRGTTAAVKTDGTLWMWGSNAYGQLGDNTTVQRSSPVQTVSGGTNWKKVSNGSSTTAAIKQDGTLWMWGDNNLFIFQTQAIGMLGDGTTVDKSSPVQTLGGKSWSQVTCGWHFTGAIQQTD